MEFSLIAAVCTAIVSTHLVSSTHPDCLIVLHLLQKEDECKVLKETSHNKTSGCAKQWDGVSCWPDASEGDVVSVQCPALLLRPGTSPGVVSRKCTERGWSRPDRSYHQACNSAAPEPEEEDDDVRTEKTHLDAVKLIYSVGYGLSLAALLVAALIFCCFRKLLCTRNLVHLHLFASFMLRSLSVFVKDGVLFSDQSTDHCTISTWRCQAAVSFSHFSVVSNFLWLLLEALNLHTLLLFSFTQTRKLLWIFTSVGWGTPAVTVLIWALLKKHLDDEGCWDDLDSRLWWIIKTPILLCICINFLMFLNISRIIAQKTKATAVTQSETHLYRTLLRSTLLLVPLFGLHYVVFALFPDHVGVRPRLYLELVLGSFQGFLVAVLFCFLNGEVQTEIRKLLRSCRPETNNMNMNMNMNMNLPTQEDVA